jgi:hypothetical protein
LRPWCLLLTSLCLACAHPGTRVQTSPSADFSHYQHIGVAPFTDHRGKGRLITEGIDGGLRLMLHGGADQKMVAEILKKQQPDPDFGFAIEALESLRTKAAADAVVNGAVARDWSSASLNMIDTETGESVLKALLKPKDRKQKAFTSPQEIVEEALRVFAALFQ